MQLGSRTEHKKTKIFIFNKQGANMKKFKYYYRDKEIDVAKQYTYLGFTFTLGKKQVRIDNLMSKARKTRLLYKNVT